MRTDVQDLEDGAVLDADVCVVGSGPAGVSLALALEGRGLHVLLLEGGREDFDPEASALYEGESACNADEGLDDYLMISRARVLGGTSTLWAGWCRPLEPEDFEVRPWIPHSGWPIAFDDLAPYYDDATAVLEIAPFPGTQAWEGSSRPPLDLDPSHLETRMWQFSRPTRFGTAYLPDLETSTDIELVLDANLVGVRRSGGAIEALELTTLSGKSFEARGRAIVLATGGIENARLLLALGLGNDNTGRFFQEHPGLRGAMELQIGREALSLYVDRAEDEVLETRCMGLLALPSAKQASEQLANHVVMLRSVGEVEQDDTSRAAGAWLAHLTGQAPIVGLAMSMSEQIPNPDSRITLLSATDAFGMPRARLDWNVLPQDWENIVRSLELTADGLAAAGVGRGRALIDRESPWPSIRPGMHAMGTTRMADGPADGVVDADCRVFGVDNLYMAGSSVFPTGGAANPTLTIVALSLRLADHLAEVL
jgi:choline dehydrogenase-like flavoprotein